MHVINLDLNSGRQICSECKGAVVRFCSLCLVMKCESCNRLFPEGPCPLSKSGEHNRP